MHAVDGERARSPTTAEAFLWLGPVGYVRVQTLIRGTILLYVFFTSLVTVVATDFFTLLVVGLGAVIVLQLASLDRHISPCRRATVYLEDGFFVAEHVATGVVRHGTTLTDALRNLDRELSRHLDADQRA